MRGWGISGAMKLVISFENLQKLDYIITGIEWDLYILKKKEFSVFATILDAILDFSACHQLCQFMPAVSETTNITEHFGT